MQGDEARPMRRELLSLVSQKIKLDRIENVFGCGKEVKESTAV